MKKILQNILENTKPRSLPQFTSVIYDFVNFPQKIDAAGAATGIVTGYNDTAREEERIKNEEKKIKILQ